MTQNLYTPPSPPPWRIALVNLDIKGLSVHEDLMGMQTHVCIVSEDDNVVAVLGRYDPNAPNNMLERTMADARAIAALPFTMEALFTLRDALAAETCEKPHRTAKERGEYLARHPAMKASAAALDMAAFGIGLPSREYGPPDADTTKH